MKGNGRRNVWLALGLVAMACLVLAGCPHSGLLEGGGGGGLANGGGGRGGGDGVQLVITNFVADGAASRSASWLGGPQKTIAPENINLKDAGVIDQYIFIASGTGNGTYPAEFINVAETTGAASLNISGGGIWDITVNAYAVDLLTGKPGVTGGDKDAIMAVPGNVAVIEGLKDEALVLTGRATVDLGGGSQVTMTLTNDGVGSDGNVNVSVNFATPEDVAKITDNNYKVKVALYDYTTGDVVQTGAGPTEQEIHGGAGAITPPVQYNVSDVGKGVYQFRVTVTDGQDKPVAYWSDDIYVEGNRTTTGTVDIYNLFNTPTAPTDLKVYYSPRRDTDLKSGYLAYIAWDGLSYNAAGIVLEIADITTWYNYDTLAAQYKVNFTGLGGNDVTLVDHDALWTEIDRVPQIKDSVVTSISWKDSPQKATNYPAIWMNGSMMNGSKNVTFLMETGCVYSIRIKAAGAVDDSGWINYGIVGTGAITTAPTVLPGVAGVGNATEFTKTSSTGLFDLYEVKYELGDNYLLYRTRDGITIGDRATSAQLLSYQEYDPAGTGYAVTMKYATNVAAPQTDDWLLYPRIGAAGGTPVFTDRIMTWLGWKNKNNITEKYTSANTWGTPYKGYSNLSLIPDGAGGTVIVQAETSGTFNVLNQDKILVDTLQTAGTATWGELSGSNDADVKTTGLGLGKDNTRYILNLKRGATPSTYLYVTVGDDPASVGTLTDQNNSEFRVQEIKVSLAQGLRDIVVFNTATDKVETFYQMDGVASGDYTLKVKILADSGYWQTYQVPIVVKYDDQTITP